MTALEVAHAKAGLDLIEATDLPLYRGKLPPNVTTLNPPWVLVFTSVEWPDDDGDLGLDHASSTCLTTWYCYASGTTDTSALAASGIVRAALIDVVPTITGRICSPIGQVSSEPPRQHEGTGTSVLTAMSIYELRTRPA